VASDDCPKCGGTGYVAKPVDMNGKSEGVAFIHLKCPACGGSGRKPSTLPTTVGWPHGLRCLRNVRNRAVMLPVLKVGGPGRRFSKLQARFLFLVFLLMVSD